jgi:hypothetical protein
MFLLFVVPRSETSGNAIVGGANGAVMFAARQETAPDLNVWSSLETALDNQLNQKSKQLDQKNNRLQKIINILNKQRNAENKMAQIRKKSSLVSSLNFWADTMNKIINQASGLEKKLGNINTMLQKTD